MTMLLFVERDVVEKRGRPRRSTMRRHDCPHSVNRVETDVLSKKNGGHLSILRKYAKLQAEREARTRVVGSYARVNSMRASV
jgi:hypothetical protein